MTMSDLDYEKNTHLFRFDKDQRLLKSAEYKQVFNSKQIYHGRYFLCYFQHNDRPLARLGIVVSKKVSKKAVIRNSLKRQIREAFRLYQSPLKEYDVVVIGRAKGVGIESHLLREDLNRMWHKMSV